MSNNFSITVSNLSSGGENPCLIILTSLLLATVDLTEYHFIINLKDRQINGITFFRNSAIPRKYGIVEEVELCLKILSTNCLCSPSLSLIFSYIERPPRIFVQLSLQTSKRDHLEKVKIYFCNFPILYRQRSSEKS